MTRYAALKALGLSAGASDADVRRAFRERARPAHPDHGGNVDDLAVLLEARAMLLTQGTGEWVEPEVLASYEAEPVDERRRRNLKLDLNLDLVAVLRTAMPVVVAAVGSAADAILDYNPLTPIVVGLVCAAVYLAVHRGGVPFEWAAPGAVVFGVLAWWVVLALPGVVGIAAAAGAVTTDRRI